MSTSGVSSSTTSGLITPQSITTSGGITSSSTLTNSGAGGQLQITGLASGINTNALIQALLAEKEMPLTNMQDSITSLQNENSMLQTAQTGLQTVAMDAFDLGAPSLFFQSQTVNSSNSSLVTATTTANVGAVIGSTTISVAQLATASQATYGYTAPTDGSTDTLSITVGGGQAQSVTVNSGDSLQTIANNINGDRNGVAYATVMNGQLVISARATGSGGTTGAPSQGGSDSGNPIVVTDTNSATNATDTLGQASSTLGQDAEIYINGSLTPTFSQSDTVTNAIAGISLTLQGVTPANAPVTITTSTPAVNTQSIIGAVQQFVTDYNDIVSKIEGTVNTLPASASNSSQASPYTNNLFGDSELENLLSRMRSMMYQGGAGLPSGMASLADIGISTGASNGTVQQSAVNGMLTVDTTALTNAIETNPQGVKSVLQSWSTAFQGVVNAEASPFGALYTRMQGNNSIISNLQSQLATEQEMFTNEEKNMQAQWAKVEATLSSIKSQSSSLSAFTSSLTSSSSSSSTSGG